VLLPVLLSFIHSFVCLWPPQAALELHERVATCSGRRCRRSSRCHSRSSRRRSRSWSRTSLSWRSSWRSLIASSSRCACATSARRTRSGRWWAWRSSLEEPALLAGVLIYLAHAAMLACTGAGGPLLATSDVVLDAHCCDCALQCLACVALAGRHRSLHSVQQVSNAMWQSVGDLSQSLALLLVLYQRHCQ
jgi:hypothetical protein